ncbi:LOW QUALITY PROTEIN: hypothetical protein QTO34_008008 [Cnephaeus nilssonii]|uniref:C2H2-type domain-containing protein n=1 Tax=Cnephaeus nilssonii TaxID=3371016 RepID=A0AA40I9F6_CNENI|nr:LOW QUALITY PROTEIN: hypothetical protein QTO34_008008 [Eptesicus nilssonii]
MLIDCHALKDGGAHSHKMVAPSPLSPPAAQGWPEVQVTRASQGLRCQQWQQQSTINNSQDLEIARMSINRFPAQSLTAPARSAQSLRAASTLRRPPEGHTTLEDGIIYLSWGDDAAELCTYNIPETVAVAQRTRRPLLSSVSVGGKLQLRTPKADPPTQNTDPWEKCVPGLKDILLLTGSKPYIQAEALRWRGIKASGSVKTFHHTYCGGKNLHNGRGQGLLCQGLQIACPFTCGEVEKDFLATSGLLHQATPNGEKPQSSSEGGVPFDGGRVMVFGSRRVFSNTHPLPHQRACTEEGHDECSSRWGGFSCNGGFRTSKLTLEKGFTSEILYHKIYLLQHWRVHTGAKPDENIECGRSFSQKSDLVRHQSVLMGDRPYERRECKKSFIQKSLLIKP